MLNLDFLKLNTDESEYLKSVVPLLHNAYIFSQFRNIFAMQQALLLEWEENYWCV